MEFLADLHVHTKYSRATARDCGIDSLAQWADKKGIAVMSTGDFTHPSYFAGLEQGLHETAPGLFAVKGGNARARFVLSVEVSTVCRRDGKTRRVHHLVFVPGFEAARKFRSLVAPFGRLEADGRPVLKMDPVDLLAEVLESGEGSFLIPAHIWTPWYSVLGSGSGFGSIEECYGDLCSHIFALETGLSSDPEMNRRVAGLNCYTLVSCSDAHSPQKIAREATVFDTDINYFSILKALKDGTGYSGTLEFFPEEGKYHADGHRKCGVCFGPEETEKHKGICPVCGKPLTVGVLNRVSRLAADYRGTGLPVKAAGRTEHLVPLREILGEVLRTDWKKTAGKKLETEIAACYESLVGEFGSELDVLRKVPEADLNAAGIHPLLG